MGDSLDFVSQQSASGISQVAPKPPTELQAPTRPRSRRRDRDFDLFGTIFAGRETGALNPDAVQVDRKRLLGE